MPMTTNQVATAGTLGKRCSRQVIDNSAALAYDAGCAPKKARQSGSVAQLKDEISELRPSILMTPMDKRSLHGMLVDLQAAWQLVCDGRQLDLLTVYECPFDGRMKRYVHKDDLQRLKCRSPIDYIRPLDETAPNLRGEDRSQNAINLVHSHFIFSRASAYHQLLHEIPNDSLNSVLVVTAANPSPKALEAFGECFCRMSPSNNLGNTGMTFISDCYELGRFRWCASKRLIKDQLASQSWQQTREQISASLACIPQTGHSEPIQVDETSHISAVRQKKIPKIIQRANPKMMQGHQTSFSAHNGDDSSETSKRQGISQKPNYGKSIAHVSEICPSEHKHPSNGTIEDVLRPKAVLRTSVSKAEYDPAHLMLTGKNSDTSLTQASSSASSISVTVSTNSSNANPSEKKLLPQKTSPMHERFGEIKMSTGQPTPEQIHTPNNPGLPARVPLPASILPFKLSVPHKTVRKEIKVTQVVSLTADTGIARKQGQAAPKTHNQHENRAETVFPTQNMTHNKELKRIPRDDGSASTAKQSNQVSKQWGFDDLKVSEENGNWALQPNLIREEVAKIVHDSPVALEEAVSLRGIAAVGKQGQSTVSSVDWQICRALLPSFLQAMLPIQKANGTGKLIWESGDALLVEVRGTLREDKCAKSCVLHPIEMEQSMTIRRKIEEWHLLAVHDCQKTASILTESDTIGVRIAVEPRIFKDFKWHSRKPSGDSSACLFYFDRSSSLNFKLYIPKNEVLQGEKSGWQHFLMQLRHGSPELKRFRSDPRTYPYVVIEPLHHMVSNPIKNRTIPFLALRNEQSCLELIASMSFAIHEIDRAAKKRLPDDTSLRSLPSDLSALEALSIAKAIPVSFHNNGKLAVPNNFVRLYQWVRDISWGSLINFVPRLFPPHLRQSVGCTASAYSTLQMLVKHLQTFDPKLYNLTDEQVKTHSGPLPGVNWSETTAKRDVHLKSFTKKSLNQFLSEHMPMAEVIRVYHYFFDAAFFHNLDITYVDLDGAVLFGIKRKDIIRGFLQSLMKYHGSRWSGEYALNVLEMCQTQNVRAHIPRVTSHEMLVGVQVIPDDRIEKLLKATLGVNFKPKQQRIGDVGGESGHLGRTLYSVPSQSIDCSQRIKSAKLPT